MQAQGSLCGSSGEVTRNRVSKKEKLGFIKSLFFASVDVIGIINVLNVLLVFYLYKKFLYITL